MKKKYDVTFIGVPKADRYEFLKYLKNNGIKVNIFGTGDWEKYPDLKDAYRGSLKPEELLRVLNQSKITLCFTKNYLGFPHLVGRVFETATCKSFILVEYCPQFLKLLKKDREIVMFKDKKDLLEKVNYYLKHEKERKKIAENAYKRMVRDYNVDTEFKKFFKNIFKDRRTKKLPKLNKKITCISEKDIYLNQKDLNRKLKNTDYVYFKEGFCRSLPFRTYIQAYSLEKLKKQISCCNYYVYSRGLGNYLYFFSHYAFNTLPKKDFSSLITINQLMITKQYFLKNIKKFKHFFRGKEIDFINKQNTAFVSIPLIQINKIKKIQYEDMKKVFEMKFLLKLSSLAHKKKLFSSSYTYKLLLQGLSQNFILKYLSGWFNKKRLKSLMKIYIS